MTSLVGRTVFKSFEPAILVDNIQFLSLFRLPDQYWVSSIHLDKY